VRVQDNYQAGLGVEIPLTDCRVIFDAMSDAILIHDVATGAILDVNQGMCGMFGYTPEEARELMLTALGGNESGLSPESVRSLMVKAAGGSPQVFEWQVRDRAGRVFWVEAHLKPVRINGRDRILTVLRDIDQRKQAEAALKESETYYRMVTEGSLAGVYVIQEGGFAYVNSTMAQTFGYQPEEIMSRAVEPRDLIYPDDLPMVRENIRRRLCGELEAAHYTFRGLHRDGSVIYCESFGRAVEYQGRPAIVGTLLNITERKQGENIRRQAYAELERLVAERTAGLQSANTQLHREIVERRRNEAIIRLQRDLGLTLSGKVGLHETLRLCVETGIIISGLDSGAVYLVDPTSGVLDLAYHQGLSPEFVQQESHYEADALNTYLVMAGEPLYARLEDLPGLMDEDGLKEGLRSVAVIPIIHQDRVIASLNIASHQYEEVPATARAALETLAVQVGSAIARVQAEEALRRAKEELEIRVAERTAQLRQANERLEEELRVRATIEQSLRRSEAKYRTLVEQIPAVTYITSLTDGVDYFYISPQIETLLGFSPGEWRAEGMETWKQQTHPDDREWVVAELTHSIATGKPFTAEYRILSKSGRVVWFRDDARVIHDQEGGFLFLQGLALDITARKQAEEALRETTHTLQTLIQASPLAIIALDRDLKIRLWNPGAERTFGWRESEVLGHHLPYIPADQQAEALARIKRSLAGEMHAALELRRQKKDGTPIDLQLWTAALTDAREEHVGIMGIFADITERKRAEEALKKSERELRLLTARLLSIQEEERRRVARELHDELGQSLTVLKIHLVSIEEKLSAKQQHLKATCEQMLSYIDTVIENVRRLSWDLSPSSLEDLGLSSALGYLVDETCRNHQMQSAVVMDEIDPLFSPETQINIYRIFQESLTNVIKHARASLVSVEVKRGNGKVSFMIRDNGRGFDLKRAISRKGARRSLGLTAMNERALMANGSLQISSRKGQGTTIKFTIPIGKPGK
jgi:PAS domain S-box-containing protein